MRLPFLTKLWTRIRYAIWAFVHAEDLSMLEHELKTDMAPDLRDYVRDKRGDNEMKWFSYQSKAALRAYRYHARYIASLPQWRA